MSMNQPPFNRPSLVVRPLWPARLPLMRPKQGRWIAGVARGVSMHIGVHVGWIRVLFAVMSLLAGAGIVAYALLWVLVPMGDPVTQAQRLRSHIPLSQAPLAKGNIPYSPVEAVTGAQFASEEAPDYTGLDTHADGHPVSIENAQHMLAHASKPALIACAGAVCLATAILITRMESLNSWAIAAILALLGVSIAWIRFNSRSGHVIATVIGVVLVFIAYVIIMAQTDIQDGAIPLRYSIAGGLGLITCIVCVLVPITLTALRSTSHERALKEREEERADMTAHLHDGVLQTLALIQLHANDPQQVFTLARSQERELRNWLYQERTPTDRSVNAGLQQLAAQIEDTHGKAIDVVTVGDARPSAQTDALLDAAAQAMINAVKHGQEPISVYCEASAQQVEVFVRDHGNGFNIDAIDPSRLGIRESIIGRIERRGGTVEIVSRPQWGTEVRMHMPIAVNTNPEPTPKS